MNLLNRNIEISRKVDKYKIIEINNNFVGNKSCLLSWYWVSLRNDEITCKYADFKLFAKSIPARFLEFKNHLA